jgi:hypothetical protein
MAVDVGARGREDRDAELDRVAERRSAANRADGRGPPAD